MRDCDLILPRRPVGRVKTVNLQTISELRFASEAYANEVLPPSLSRKKGTLSTKSGCVTGGPELD